MTFDQFVDAVAAAKSGSAAFAESDMGRDPPASASEIASLEQALGRKLPYDYRLFLQHFGGGYFGFANVFSASETSDWNLIRQQKWLRDTPSFLAISDDQCGGFYGYADDTSRIFYVYPSESEPPEMCFSNLFEFLETTALKVSR